MLDEVLAAWRAHRGEAPAVRLDELPQVPLGIAWMGERMLGDPVLERVDRVVEERRKKQRAAGPHMPAQDREHGVGVGRVEVREYGKQPDDVERAINGQARLRSDLRPLQVVL